MRTRLRSCRGTHPGCVRWLESGRSTAFPGRARCRCASDWRSKVCAFLPIRKKKARVDVKSFSVRFGSVLLHCRSGRQPLPFRWHRSKATWVPIAKVLLLSAFLSVCVFDAFSVGRLEATVEVVGRCSGRRFRKRAEGCRRENFSWGLLTVKKSVIRFRPADLACQESEQNRHPVAKHNQDIRLESDDGGVGFASLGEKQGHPSFDTCRVVHGRHHRIRHDAHDATAVPARHQLAGLFQLGVSTP